MIRIIEELSLNALPALQTMYVDGWVLRFAKGYTKRANSVNSLYASTRNTHEKIRFCKEIYRRKQLPVVFKMTRATQPKNLDVILASNGYESNSRTSVQTAEIGNIDPDSFPDAQVNNMLTEEWFAYFCRMNNVRDKNQSTLWQILENIALPKCFVTVRDDRKPTACGLSALQVQYCGLFDIVTDASVRRKGFGRQTVQCLLAWGKQNCARQAYLQVMLNNTPALRFYNQLGFREVYQYWYRIKQ